MSAPRSLAPAVPLLLLLGACSAAKPPQDAADSAAAPQAAAQAAEVGAVTLDAGQVERLGLQAAPAQPAEYREEQEGYAQVWSHEAVAQAVAEASAADAALRQSAAALARLQKLADTAGAFPADALESAQRQQAADQAALLLAQRRLSALLGDRPPLGQGLQLADIASGHVKLVRVTFPIGTALSTLPGSVRLLPLDAGAADKGWSSRLVWSAPADPTLPGRSLWVAVAAPAPAEGDRLMARVPVGEALRGILVPDAALVVSEDHAWCFIERPGGHYIKVSAEPAHPVAGGYVVARGLSAGDRIVVHGAGLLLARATGAGGAEE